MSGTLTHIQRLKEHQESKIRNCLERINEFEKLQEDYCALKSRLETISDKLAYDVMVPINDMAFMPGSLVHTNEILVLLGDNWLVERSAKQAVLIAERRLQSCKEMLDAVQKKKQQYTEWMAYTSEVDLQANEDLVEIIEEYDPEKEMAWNEQHKTNVRKFKKEMAQKRMNDDIIEKLEALELQERSNSSEDMQTSILIDNKSGDLQTRQVKWKDEVDRELSFTNLSTVLPVAEHKEESNEDDVVIQSPADIYKQFAVLASPEPKSILKNKYTPADMVEASENLEINIQPECKKEAPVVQAFSGEVVERIVSDGSSIIGSEKETRPTSRFKAGRKKTY